MPRQVLFPLEQVMGIEPTYSAWEADVLPMNYTCGYAVQYSIPPREKSRGNAQKLFGGGFQDRWVKMVFGVRAPLENQTLSTSPMPRYSVALELPPALKKGSVMPMTGSRRVAMPMLMML